MLAQRRQELARARWTMPSLAQQSVDEAQAQADAAYAWMKADAADEKRRPVWLAWVEQLAHARRVRRGASGIVGDPYPSQMQGGI